MSSDGRFLRLPEVLAKVGLSRSDVYRRITDATFPKQIRISHKVAVWRETDINAWMNQQAEGAM